MKETINTITNQIMDKIKSGAVHQRPRWYFVLLTLLIAGGFIILGLILLYLVSFVALVLREHLIFQALSFGPGTVFEIMHELPLVLVLLVAAVFIVLHVLVRNFSFAFMKPVTVTLITGLLLVLLAFGLVLDFDEDSHIARFGEGSHIGAIDYFHQHFRDRIPPKVLHCQILSKNDDGYNVQDVQALRDINVHVTSTTRTDKPSYDPGDFVSIFAIVKGDDLYALGIRMDNASSTNGNISH